MAHPNVSALVILLILEVSVILRCVLALSHNHVQFDQSPKGPSLIPKS